MPSPSKKITYSSPLLLHAKFTAERSVVLRLLFDTGATTTMIPMKAALAIGCDPSISTERISIVTASAVEYAPIICLSSVTCLGRQINDLKVICHDLPPQSSVDGLLGMDIIGHLPSFQKFRDSISRFLL